MKMMKTYKTRYPVLGFQQYKVLRLRNKILKAYRRLGETRDTIKSINHLAMPFFRDFKQSGYYQKQHQNLLSRALEKAEYQRLGLIENGLLKMTLHVMPKGYLIPMHAHPGMFSVTMVDRGTLDIRHDSWGRSYPLQVTAEPLLLNSQEISTGLPVKNNLHQIQARSELAVFFSLRVNLKPKPLRFSSTQSASRATTSVFQQIMAKKRLTLPGLVMGLIPLISLSGASHHIALSNNDYADQVLASEKEQIYLENSHLERQTAAQLRATKDDSSQAEALLYYQKAALKGDAESQYWLGVMYLDGSGITEDDDAALEWISRSAQQNYEPAEKLLAHLLATDFDMDC